MRADLMRGAVAAAVVALVVAAVQAGAGVATDHGGAGFVALALTLGTYAALPLMGLAIGLSLAARLAVAAVAGPARARSYPGLFSDDQQRPLVASIVHGAAVASGLFVAGATVIVEYAVTHFVDATLIGVLAAVLSLLWLALSMGAGLTVFVLVRGRRIIPAQRAFLDPLVSPKAAVTMWLFLLWVAALAGVSLSARWRMVFPVQLAFSLTLTVLLLMQGRRIAGWLCTDRGRPRRATWLGIAVVLVFAGISSVVVNSAAARRGVTRSPTLSMMFRFASNVTDVDRDGVSSLFGQGDCAPFDSSVHPGAVDLPDDGIDQNCVGGDFVRVPRPSPLPAKPVPAALRRSDYSILLVTIDTVRWDHTGAAGYDRPTTPALDALAARGAFFENSYSVGNTTQEVLPVIAASQYMEKIPRDPRLASDPQAPRRLQPGVTTLAEVLSKGGYRTAMFTSSKYFQHWNLDQGMDDHVNVLESGSPTAYETAPELTRRAIDWLASRSKDEKWFVWVHYLEPHWPYEKHATSQSFGDSPTDLYDGELRFVDDQLGVLVNWIGASELWRDRTIVVVTSDHGESLGNNGRYGHGGDVLQYLVEVPLVIAVPGAEPRRVTTPSSSIDLAPTLAAFAGVPPDGRWIGRALVPEIAYGDNDPDRIVFATEPGGRIYAAITARWKLVYQERVNLWRLSDLVVDPAEKQDVSAEHRDIRQRLETALIRWREWMVGAELPEATR